MKLRMGERELELGGRYLGDLHDSTADRNNHETLRERMAEEGYLLIRGLHDRDKVEQARRVILENLRENDQLDPDAELMEGKARQGGRGQFVGGAKSLTHTPAFLNVVESTDLMAWFSDFLQGPALTFDYKWLRAIAPGANTGAHYDVVYMGRGTRNLYTLWTPLGDVSYDMGPLAIWGGSHQLDTIKQTYGEMDVDRDNAEGHFSKDPVELVDRYGGQWLTTEFQMGDALIFGMFTMHGSLTNQSDRYRISCDTRYQLASEPVDERWVGENPKAHYAWGKEGEMKTIEEMREKWGV